MIYPFLRNILFQLPPETSHDLTLQILKQSFNLRLLPKKIYRAPVNVMGITFPNPVGLAAGLDKNGEYIDALAAFGFGFIEIGTVTPKPQPGNPKARLFRLPKAQAIINRLGFNSKGVDFLIEQLKRTKYQGILGINIGKNFSTPILQAKEDYLYCMECVYPFASYITVNISSPNTPGLRELQFGEYFNNLLASLKNHQKRLHKQFGKYVPLTIKVSPDLNSEEIRAIATSLLQHHIDGLIATNTTVSREAVAGMEFATEKGGLSGQPLFAKSTQVVEEFAKALGNEIPIIAVGGIMDAKDAEEKIKAGASLVQIYTGFIYQGPKLIKEIVDLLA
jgi:dihydroorotate dehydrogenase